MSNTSHRTQREVEAVSEAKARKQSRRAAQKRQDLKAEYILNRWIPDRKKILR